jgi:hypothetical protein
MEGMFDRATGYDRIGHAIKLWYRYPSGPLTLARYCSIAAIWSALLMHQRYVLDARGMSPNETSTLAEVETGNSAMVGRGVW